MQRRSRHGGGQLHVDAAQRPHLDRERRSERQAGADPDVQELQGLHPARQSYRIYVAVTVKDTTIGIDEVDVRIVAPGATSKWDGNLGTGASGATCVLRVERTQRA